jgi:hypothetical protein
MKTLAILTLTLALATTAMAQTPPTSVSEMSKAFDSCVARCDSCGWNTIRFSLDEKPPCVCGTGQRRYKLVEPPANGCHSGVPAEAQKTMPGMPLSTDKATRLRGE